MPAFIQDVMWPHNKKIILLLVLLFYALGLNYLILHAPVTVFPVPDVEPITSVESLASSAESPALLDWKTSPASEPPAGNTASHPHWQKASLPDDWYINQHRVNQLWYRASVPTPVNSDLLWAVYLPSVTHNAAVFINGVWVGQGGSFTEPVSRHHNQPLLFAFSADLLREENNRIDIRVASSYAMQGLLGPFYVAPLKQLEPAWQWKHFVRFDFIKSLTLTMYTLGLITLAFWLLRPQDIIYGIFSLEIFLWASHNLNLFVTSIPVSTHLWESMTMSTLGWTVVAMIFFNHRYVGDTNPKLEKFMLFFALLGMGTFFLPDIASILQFGYGIWDSFLIIFGGYAIYFLIKTYWRKPDTDYYLMLLVGTPILVCGLHDILVVNHLRDKTEGLIIQYSAFPAMILFSWFLIRRFVEAVTHSEQLAATLEQRVHDKEQELKIQYRQLNRLERQNVLSDERERIMRDMHDGIGGQLVSVITSLQEHQGHIFDSIRRKLQDSLTDLRFVIDSLDPVLSDIPTLLGMMRMRLKSQLDAANIELDWAVTDLPEIANMSPRRSLHIMRIIQEAIANSIKHSGSEKMTVATGTYESEQKIFIDIIDYGKGLMKSVEQHSGRGINNMRYRAKELGGLLEIQSVLPQSNADFPGTRVRLLLSH